MNRNIKILLIGLGATLCIYVTARFTGVLTSYRIPTNSNEPAIKLDDHVWLSNLKDADRGSIIVFSNAATDSANYRDQENIPRHVYIYRLCAVGHDVIQMKNGDFYVNGKNADLSLNLYHCYKVPDMSDVEGLYDPAETDNIMMVDNGSPVVNLTTEMIRKIKPGSSITRYITPIDTSEAGAFQWFEKNSHGWSADNFGPLEVPAGCGFVLGDNRHNALDSRYWGFISLRNIKGVKL